MNQPQPGTALAKEQMVDLVAENLRLNTKIKDERKSLTAMLVSVIVALGFVIVFLLYLTFVHFPQDKVLATANAATVCQVPLLDKPYVSEAQVLDFAEQAVISIYTYNYGDYRMRTQQAANQYFSNSFADAFVQLRSNSQELQDVIQKRFVVTSVSSPNQPPVVARYGPYKGSYAWEMLVPVSVYYTSGREQFEEKKLATVTVEQVPLSPTNPRGLAVDNIVLRQALN
jgi:intracellular multiplication protein IcmL